METLEKVSKRSATEFRFENDVLKTIYERRSIRKYKDQPVEKKLIERVIDAGRIAPSAMNRQPWKFYVLTNKEEIKTFSAETAKAAIKGVIKSGMRGIVKKGIKGLLKTGKELLHSSHGLEFIQAEDPIFHGAPVVIFITSPTDNEWAPLDIGMCSQNMMLAARSFGLDSCPVGLGKFVAQTKIFSRLNIPEGEQVNLAIIIGYGDEDQEVKPRMKDNLFYIGS